MYRTKLLKTIVVLPTTCAPHSSKATPMLANSMLLFFIGISITFFLPAYIFDNH